MKLISTVVLLVLAFDAMAQESIEQEPELLGRLLVKYQVDPEGLYSPGSPYVDKDGRLIFGSLKSEDGLIVFSNGVFASSRSPMFLQGSTPIVSQQGYGVLAGRPIISSGNRIRVFDIARLPEETQWDQAYSLYSGVLLFSERKKTSIGISVRPETSAFAIEKDVRGWIIGQPGNLSLDDDGLLFRNGTLFSASRPKTFRGNYRGRLASGHVIWAGNVQDASLAIATPQGEIELRFDVPRKEAVLEGSYRYDYGVGPYGELYYLLPPDFVASGKYFNNGGGDSIPLYEPDPRVPSELVVVRNHLKYFGRLNDGGVRLRKDPSTTGEILGTFPAKTGFRILEKGTNEETIGKQKNVWYKVRLLDGKEGWFFGSFVWNLYDGPNGKAPPWPNLPDW